MENGDPSICCTTLEKAARAKVYMRIKDHRIASDHLEFGTSHKNYYLLTVINDKTQTRAQGGTSRMSTYMEREAVSWRPR